MKKISFVLIIVMCFSLLSCEKDNPDPEIEEFNPQDEIIGIYDCKEYIWYRYDNGGGNKEPQIHNEVIEIKKKGNNYDFYVNGYWSGALIFERVFDNILYCKVYEQEGFFSSSNTLYDMSGWNSTLADYPASEVTFQIKKNNKLEVCFRYYNLRNVLTNEPLDFWIIIYYEGNRR